MLYFFAIIKKTKKVKNMIDLTKLAELFKNWMFIFVLIFVIIIGFNLYEDDQFKDWNPFYRGFMGMCIHIVIGTHLGAKKIITTSKVTAIGFVLIHWFGIYLWSYMAVAESDSYNPVPNAIAFGFIPAMLFMMITSRYQIDLARSRYIESGKIKQKSEDKPLTIEDFPEM